MNFNPPDFYGIKKKAKENDRYLLLIVDEGEYDMGSWGGPTYHTINSSNNISDLKKIVKDMYRRNIVGDYYLFIDDTEDERLYMFDEKKKKWIEQEEYE